MVRDSLAIPYFNWVWFNIDVMFVCVNQPHRHTFVYSVSCLSQKFVSAAAAVVPTDCHCETFGLQGGYDGTYRQYIHRCGTVQ